MKKIAVLASGNGSNLQAIIEAIERKSIQGAEVSLVISDKKDAYALSRAKTHGICTNTFDPKCYLSRHEYDRDLVTYLQEHKIDLVVLAGYMRIVSPYFVAAYRHRIMNIHPALLPAFSGTH